VARDVLSASDCCAALWICFADIWRAHAAQRWFILYGKHVAYYEKDETTRGKLIAKGCIHIHNIKCEPTKHSKHAPPHAPFFLHADERLFLLVAPTVAERNLWMNAFKRVNDRVRCLVPVASAPPPPQFVPLPRALCACGIARSLWLTPLLSHLAAGHLLRALSTSRRSLSLRHSRQSRPRHQHQ
jgi:hypothetical protein